MGPKQGSFHIASVVSAGFAFAFPSIAEGFGLPVLEAMQAGVPVICSDTSSLPEVAGGAAVLVNPADPDAIGKELISIYRNEGLRTAFIEKGLQRAADFNWNDTATKIYQQLQMATQTR